MGGDISRGRPSGPATSDALPALDLAKGARDDSRRVGVERFYLMVFGEHSSRICELPRDGIVVVGREGGTLELHDAAVSRRHAEITMVDGEATIRDLQSHNGTFVNGERAVRPRALAGGDSITICNFTLIYYRSHRPHHARPFLDAEQFRQRLEEELERALRFGRELALATVSLAKDPLDRQRVHALLSRQLRLTDVVAWGGGAELLILMPETGAHGAPKGISRLIRALSPYAPLVRAGLSTYPADGLDADTLMLAARSAVREAQPGGLGTATFTFRRLEVGGSTVVIADPAMTRLYELIDRLAKSDLPILISGETGTGKELAASALHHWSARREKPLVPVNCAAIHENLVESEIFGHVKGAFSGAIATKEGLLESAHGGTVFLDEIGELSAGAQAKLLRALETGKVMRIGDVREREIDIRIVAATNRNLEEEIQAGRFRRDLYFRLSGGTLFLPPLRDRARELLMLAKTFLSDACARVERSEMALSSHAMHLLSGYSWPGNVRELRNLMEYFAATVSGTTIEAAEVSERLDIRLARRPSALDPASHEGPTGPGTPVPHTPAQNPNPVAVSPRFRPLSEEIADLERTRIAEALDASDGVQTRAAELIGMPRRTFVAKLKELGISDRGPGRPRGR